MPNDPTAILLASATAYVSTYCKGKLPRELRITLAPDGCVVLPLVASTEVSGQDTTGGAEPSAAADQILELLAEATTPLKAVTIARRLNRAYSGSFRAALKEMREREEIVVDANGRYILAE